MRRIMLKDGLKPWIEGDWYFWNITELTWFRKRLSRNIQKQVWNIHSLNSIWKSNCPLRNSGQVFLIKWLSISCYTAGAITNLKISVGWTTDKFWLNNSLAINGTILRFAYRKIDVQRRTCTNFWDFCCSYHQIIAVWILVLEGRDKKGGFVETNSNEYSISRSKCKAFLSQVLLTIQ